MFTKFILGALVLIGAAGLIFFKAFPYFKAYDVLGQIGVVTEDRGEFDFIFVESQSGNLLNFKVKGKLWEIVSKGSCVKLKIYPSLIVTGGNKFKNVSLEKLVDCSEVEIVNYKEQIPGMGGLNKKVIKEETLDEEVSSEEESIQEDTGDSEKHKEIMENLQDDEK